MTNDDAAAAAAARWDRTYAQQDPATLTWHQTLPVLSLQFVDMLQVRQDAAVIDVGGGTSGLAESLAERGFTDVSVLDVSGAALAGARLQAGSSVHVTWIRDSVLTWIPPRVFDLWHDRAMFHFLTEPADRDRYLAALHTATKPGSAIVIATFAPDGPDHCSGLSVQRYSGEDLRAALGGDFETVAVRAEVHVTPSGVTQPFTWLAARRLST